MLREAVNVLALLVVFTALHWYINSTGNGEKDLSYSARVWWTAKLLQVQSNNVCGQAVQAWRTKDTHLLRSNIGDERLST